MSRIKIKNFGADKRAKVRKKGRWIDIKKVTVFTGNQGSGKTCSCQIDFHLYMDGEGFNTR